MPDLQHRLRTHDLGFMKIVAGLWGLDLNAPDARTALPKLTRQMLDPALVAEIVAALADDTRRALDALVINEGWMPWRRFTRTFGSLREMGPGKRDREQPYLEPISPTEALWYRGLIGRDFLRREGTLQECAYIPDDLLERMPEVVPVGPEPPGRAASQGERACKIQVSDRILDHTCTLLAALRLEDPDRSPATGSWQPPVAFVHALLAAMKLITSSEQPVPEDARPFLEMSRGDALVWLVKKWRDSTLFNELHLMPDLICEGAWQNDPKEARDHIMVWLSEIPEGTWWNLDSFIKAVYKRDPDFQRPAGDFDTWLLRDAESGESLKGIEHWDDVDGALIRYLLTGPMHWLGLIDLASPGEDEPIKAFRFSDWSSQLLMDKPPENMSIEDHPIESFSDGKLTASTLTPRLARYQVSRFCLWVAETQTKYTYQLTPTSLSTATAQGLKTAHLETLLNKFGDPPPPSLLNAIQQWEKAGGQAKIQPGILLIVDTPQILKVLRDSPAGRFISDPLGPTSALIFPGAVDKVSAALARLGYLSDTHDIDLEIDEPGEPEL